MKIIIEIDSDEVSEESIENYINQYNNGTLLIAGLMDMLSDFVKSVKQQQ